MGETNLEAVVRNIDRRLEKVEQFLPQLATKEELRTNVAAAIAPLATKEELRTSIAAAVAPLATRQDLEDKFRHAQVMFESLQDSIRAIAEGLAHLTLKVDQVIASFGPKLEDHAVRILALEGRPATRRRR
jgi:DNA repair ATPase RecN